MTEAPVSKSQEKVFPPALAVTLGLILSPLKGVIKEQTLPALTSTVITAKYKGKVSQGHNYIASIALGIAVVLPFRIKIFV